MKIAVFTTYTEDYREIANISVPQIKKYCEINGYDFHLYEGMVDDNRLKSLPTTQDHAAWQRIVLLEKLCHYDYIFYTDVDVIIMNNIKLESFIDESDIYVMGKLGRFNSGAWLVKGNTCCDLIDKSFQRGKKPGDCWEQDAFNFAVKSSKIKLKSCWIQMFINHYKNNKDKCFILHFPWGTFNDFSLKVDAMNHYLKESNF